MMRRPPRRLAPGARIAMRLALLPLPLTILAVLLRQLDRLEIAPLFVTLALAWLLAAVAIVAAAVALRAIWRDGDEGAGMAIGAIALAVAALILPAIVLVDLARLPRLADVSTDVIDPPLFTAAPDSVVMRPLPGEGIQAAQLAAYPAIVPRHYPLAPARVYQAIDGLVAARGWTVTDERAPDADNEVGWIEAGAKTFLLALPVDVVIRVIADGTGTLVDMRSAVRIGAHDLGDDAARIGDFFADLDTSLQGVAEPDDDARPAEPQDDDTAAPLPPIPEPAPVSRR